MRKNIRQSRAPLISKFHENPFRIVHLFMFTRMWNVILFIHFGFRGMHTAAYLFNALVSMTLPPARMMFTYADDYNSGERPPISVHCTYLHLKWEYTVMHAISNRGTWNNQRHQLVQLRTLISFHGECVSLSISYIRWKLDHVIS